MRAKRNNEITAAISAALLAAIFFTVSFPFKCEARELGRSLYSTFIQHIERERGGTLSADVERRCSFGERCQKVFRLSVRAWRYSILVFTYKAAQ